MNLSHLKFDEEAWRFSRLGDKLPSSVTPVTMIASVEADITLMGNQIHVNNLPEGIQQVTTPIRGVIYHDDMARLSTSNNQQLHLEVTKTPSRPLRVAVVRPAHKDGATLAFLTLKVKSGASCSVLETCDGGETGLTAQTHHFHLESNATLDHAMIIRDGNEAVHVSTLEYLLEKDATLRQTVLSLGAKIARVQLGISLNGENAHAHAASLSALSGKAHMDIFSHIQHNAPRSYSFQKAKNFLDHESRGIFTGRIVIAKDSQQVAAQQMNRNLLLSKKAHAMGQPQLEIYADDVKCAHGSSTGMVEEESTFYLESRGISPKRAQEMLSQAFVQEVFGNSHDPVLVKALEVAFQGRT